MPGRTRWRYLALEGVVIVASILLAFALDAWWDSRSQRQEEFEVLENLRSEFQAAGSQLDRYLILHQTTLTSIETILRSARAAYAAGEAQAEVATVDLARTLIAPTFDPRTGTLQGLLASGRLGILRNDDLPSLQLGQELREIGLHFTAPWNSGALDLMDSLASEPRHRDRPFPSVFSPPHSIGIGV
jgi:hypothetical protein